jgi:non-canonical (house-cleaning) NTP pyrophosphatase
MKITKQHLNSLASLIRDVDERNTIGCDGCFELMSQYADAMLEGIELDDAMQAVQIHLSECPCCRYEYEALQAALEEVATAQ